MVPHALLESIHTAISLFSADGQPARLAAVHNHIQYVHSSGRCWLHVDPQPQRHSVTWHRMCILTCRLQFKSLAQALASNTSMTRCLGQTATRSRCMRTLRRSSDQCWMVCDTALGSCGILASCTVQPNSPCYVAQLSDEAIWLATTAKTQLMRTNNVCQGTMFV